MHVADDPSPRHHVNNILDRFVGGLHRRGVIDHQDQPGEYHDQEQESEDDPQSEGELWLHGMGVYPGCMNVQKEVARDPSHPVFRIEFLRGFRSTGMAFSLSMLYQEVMNFSSAPTVDPGSTKSCPSACLPTRNQARSLGAGPESTSPARL